MEEVGKNKAKASGLHLCPGSIAYACPYRDPYHLKNPNDTFCYASQKLWKTFRLLLSLKWQERKDLSVTHIPLQTLINSTNWYLISFLSISLFEIKKKKNPFACQRWLHDGNIGNRFVKRVHSVRGSRFVQIAFRTCLYRLFWTDHPISKGRGPYLRSMWPTRVTDIGLQAEGVTHSIPQHSWCRSIRFSRHKYVGLKIFSRW